MSFLAETARLAVRMDLEGNLSKGINGITKDIGKLDKGFGRVGKGAGQLSSGVAKAGVRIGAGIAALGVGAAKVAIDYESAFAGVRKTVSATDEEFKTLSDRFREMARTSPIEATELARLGEMAGALGVNVDAIDEFVDVTSKLGIATDLTADAAAEALGKIGNIVGLTADEYDNLGSALVNLGNKGASTEPEIIEITKRIAAAGDQAGLSAAEMLGFAEATASFTGLNPEAAGTSFAKTLRVLTKVAANGGKKFDVLNEIVGEDFKKALDKDASGALIKFLRGLGKLDKYKRAQVLKTLGLDAGYASQLLSGLSANVDDVEVSLRNADEGWKGNFLNKEAEVRFNTLASQLQVLKNNIVDAGIEIGTAFLPALGRSTKKLSEFLNQDTNRSKLKEIGEDIGRAIDGIDWKAVLDGARQFTDIMKGSVTWAKRLYDLFNALPMEIKAATVGFLALNKLSGGLIGAGAGNIIGGLGETIAKSGASRLPGIGKLFAQPVFVTNWPAGGLGGSGGFGGKGKGGGIRGFVGGMGGILAAGVAAGLAMEAVGLWEDTNSQSSEQGKTAHANLDAMLAQKPTLADMQTSLLAVNNGIKDIESNPLMVLVQGSALDELKAMRTQLETSIAGEGGRTSGVGDRPSPGNPGLTRALTQAIKDGFKPGLQQKPEVTVGKKDVPHKDAGIRAALRPGQLERQLGQVNKTGSAQKSELARIKNVMVTAKAAQAGQSAAQKAELGNIKTATANVKTAINTMNAQENVRFTVQQATLAAQAVSAAIQASTQRLATATAGTKAANASTTAGGVVSGAMGGAADRIVGAIWAARPIIQPTTIIERNTVTQRGGGTSDSRTRNGTGNV